jgi:hypothetical protein
MSLSVISFAATLQRLKEALGLQNDKEVAEALGLNPNALYNRKRLASIPYEEIVRLAELRKLQLDWILFGTGEAFRTTRSVRPDMRPNVEPELLGTILFELDRAMSLAGLHLEKRGEAAARIGLIAAQIYNECFLLDGQKQRAAIRAEAEDWASAARALERIMRSSEQGKVARQPTRAHHPRPKR